MSLVGGVPTVLVGNSRGFYNVLFTDFLELISDLSLQGSKLGYITITFRFSEFPEMNEYNFYNYK